MAAKLFYLVRLEDPTGTSGEGIIAEGVQFSQGDAMVKWKGDYPCFHWWPKGWKHTGAIHGHGGKTKIVWADDDPPTDAPGVDTDQNAAPIKDEGEITES